MILKSFRIGQSDPKLFPFLEPLKGKYMVLQRTVDYNNEPIEWMEVTVNFEPMSLNPEEKIMAAINNDVKFCC